jgi:hypothetical protein
MTDIEANALVSGALTAGYLVVALFFLRFFRQTRDRLFLIFGFAFITLALQRLALAIISGTREDLSMLYVVRLCAFAMILVAIIDKNRSR